jgi:hypothetical protein
MRLSVEECWEKPAVDASKKRKISLGKMDFIGVNIAIRIYKIGGSLSAVMIRDAFRQVLRFHRAFDNYLTMPKA